MTHSNGSATSMGDDEGTTYDAVGRAAVVVAFAAAVAGASAAMTRVVTAMKRRATTEAVVLAVAVTFGNVIRFNIFFSSF
jgi:hypothetical protein